MTLRAYASRHNWGVDRIIIELQHKKIIAAASTSTVDQFLRIIHLTGDISEQQRLKLLEVAETCAVSRTLRQVSIVESKLAGSFEQDPA